MKPCLPLARRALRAAVVVGAVWAWASAAAGRQATAPLSADTPARPAVEPTRPGDAPASAESTPPPSDVAAAAPEAQPAPPPPPVGPEVKTTLDLQVELHRRGFSCGSIDGVLGGQTEAALKAFQESAGLEPTGHLNDATRDALRMSGPGYTTYTVTTGDLASLRKVPATWLEKSQMDTLGYNSVLELVSEKFHTAPSLVEKLNPAVNWEGMLVGVSLKVPAVDAVTIHGDPVRAVIFLSEHTLNVLDASGKIIAHFPVSIARMAEKRPVGLLHVVVVVPDPDYTFDPEVFPESEEGRQLGRKLSIPPGPNNPVGVAWIGLDRPGYGIHGTPDPEKIGRTESHGCFRMANWDARTLLGLVQVGFEVNVAP
jgi:lipoprotein-anchoring transpeptidase ErfK/SrfK